MAVTYYALLTTIGAGKLANATALGTTLKITQLAVGDGGGNVPTPDASRTQLVNEVRRAPLNRLSVDPANSSQIIAEQVIPEDVGGWWIREMGLYDEAGALIAYANCAPSYKPQLAEGSGRTQTVRIVLIVSNAASVELKIDPSVVLATREYVDSAIVSAMNRLDYKQSVRAATMASVTLSGLQTVDGVALAAGDRVLVKNQTNAVDNGLYVVAAGAWKRATDADENSEVTPGLTVTVESGTAQADSVWQLVTDGVIVLGTTALTFQNITNGLARLQSPAFTGSPTAPTPAAAISDASIATTAFVRAAMGMFGIGITSVAPSILDFNDETLGSGMYYSGSGTLNPPPNSGGGQGFVLHKVYGAGAFQLFSRYGHPDFYYRSKSGTAWTNWRQVGQEALRLAGLGDVDVNVIADINDVTVGSGMYYTSSSDANRPLGVNGIVLHKITGSAGFQLFQPGGLDRLIYRRRTGGVWQSWRDIDPSVFGIGNSQYQPSWPNASLDDCTGVLSGVYRTVATITAGLPAGVSTASVVKYWIRDAASAGMYQVVQELINTSSGKRFTRVAPSNGTAAIPNWGAWREEAYTDSPAFTGVPTAPTAAAGANSAQLATTAFVQAATVPLAPLLSPVFGGVPTAPTAAAGNNSQQLATTAFVQSAISPLAPKVSPAFIGTPTAPTPSQFDSSGALATTAFVQNSGGRFPSGNGIGISGDATITVAQSGRWFEVQVAGVTVTLPALSTTQAGLTAFTFKAAVNFTLKGSSTDNILHGTSIPSNTCAVLSGQTLTIVSNGPGGSWYVVNEGFGASTFGAQKAAVGYQRLPSGLIMQWGYGITSADGTATFSWPIPFPNEAAVAMGIGRWVSPQVRVQIGQGPRSKTAGTFYCVDQDGKPGVMGFEWMALGY